MDQIIIFSFWIIWNSWEYIFKNVAKFTIYLFFSCHKIVPSIAYVQGFFTQAETYICQYYSMVLYRVIVRRCNTCFQTKSKSHASTTVVLIATWYVRRSIDYVLLWAKGGGIGLGAQKTVYNSAGGGALLYADLVLLASYLDPAWDEEVCVWKIAPLLHIPIVKFESCQGVVYRFAKFGRVGGDIHTTSFWRCSGFRG